jgi:Protein of unknown function (DUF3320)
VIPEVDHAAIEATQDGEGQVEAGLAKEQPGPTALEDQSALRSTADELLLNTGPLTSSEAVAVLERFREQIVKAEMPDWDAQRSILRPAMIETFVQQRVVDPSEWHTRIPQYLRTGTNPAEKNRFLDDICAIVERIRAVGDTPATVSVSPKSADRTPQQMQSSRAFYVISDPTKIGSPSRELFYSSEYSANLRAMIAHVIDVEGPIFEDLLIDRIARAHGMQRSGNQIRQRVVALLPRDVSRTNEGDRKVVWPSGVDTDAPHAFRDNTAGERGHEDVPLNELAALATRFIRLRLDDEAVLRKLAEQFDLGRLRETTRARFEAALRLARR